MLIPTKYKCKLPDSMSYPIGAELISSAFIGVPQFDSLELWFSFYNSVRKSKVRQENIPYEVFIVSMSHPIKSLTSPNQTIKEGFYDENWKIHIYPVPRKFKAIAKQFLINEAIPLAKKWMEAPRTEIWKTGRKEFRVMFKENEPQIFIEHD